MPNINDFETLVATADSTAHQFSAADGGGVALKGKGARLKTFLTSSQKDADKAMLRSFKAALTDAYGPEAAEEAWKKADLETRLQSGRPLSVRTATIAIQAAKTHVILAQDLRHKERDARLGEDAGKWNPDPQGSKVEGPGLRLLKQDQGEFRIHNWNAKNNPDDKTRPALELDELVEKEVAAIKAGRLKAEQAGEKVEPMSERLMYLQAKLNLTERMVSEACKPENLKEGGPTANIFLGPDMFFSPSDGPKVEGFACERTTGGACTEEEMRRITEGFRQISDRHPEVTLMPGTIVWSKPSDTIPVIDGLPRPADLAYNTAPIFSKGNLVHMTYKMTDGGDANWAAIGVNGPGGNSYTAPSSDNQFKARLQMFPENDPMMSQFKAEGQAQLKPLLDNMARQSDPLSKGREWENGLRKGGADARSPHNTVFVVEGKVMAMEICRDHTNGQARKEYAKMKTSDDPVSRLAKSQAGPGGGVNLHVMLSASNALTANGTICCSGGVAAQNDVSGGLSRSFHIESRIDQHSVKMTPGSRQQVFYYEHDAQKLKLSQEKPKVEGPGLEGPVLESVKPELPKVTMPESGGERPTLERHPSVSEVIQKGNTSSIKAKLGLDQPGTEENSVGTGKRSVRSEMGLDKPKVKVGTTPEKVSVTPKL